MSNCNLYIVYRYVDLNDNITKYIGITCKKHKIRSLESRIAEHYKKDKWAKGFYRIDYFVVSCQTDAEAFESHLISLYKTYEYYNKAKANWGISNFLPIRINWKEYITYNNLFSASRKRRDNFCFDFEKTFIIDQSKKNSIWYNKEKQGWSVYIPDESRKNKRRMISRKNKCDLENYLDKLYGTIC